MKNLKKLSKKFKEYCEYSGISVIKVRNAMRDTHSFKIIVLTQHDLNGSVDKGICNAYPYEIFNPFNLDIKINE